MKTWQVTVSFSSVRSLRHTDKVLGVNSHHVKTTPRDFQITRCWYNMTSGREVVGLLSVSSLTKLKCWFMNT